LSRARPVITGIGCVGPTGIGSEALGAALARGAPLGSIESIPLRNGTRSMRVARIPPLEQEAWIPSRKLRRMGEVSRIWTIACLAARQDAGLAGEAAAAHPPARRGIWLGTGFGSTKTTWDYLEGMMRDGAGMANPFLFSESVANAPAGHSAIELDAQGVNLTITCGDASALVALDQAARAVTQGRVDLAWCGGVECLSDPLLIALAGLGGLSFVGEGAVCLVVESADAARERGARVHAEIVTTVLGSDPLAPATDWGSDPAPIESILRRALARAGSEGVPVRPSRVRLHMPGRPTTDRAEAAAALAACPDSRVESASRVVGSLAAAAGYNLAAAILEPDRSSAGEQDLIHAMAWGGTSTAVVLGF